VTPPAYLLDSVHFPLISTSQTGAVRVLVVDDEPAVRQSLDRALRYEGYTTELVEDGSAALAAHAERPADAIVLDVAMPRMDGLEVCRRLRNASDATPVLLLTARSAVSERVAGLDAGADDYLVKPFSLEELLARLRALMRRSAPMSENEILRYADLSLDPGTREVRRGARKMELTRTEFLLLELLLRNARQVLPREVIFDRVWGYDFGANSNSLEVYIGYLRRKTEAGGEARLIHTVRGVGYVLRLAEN
jgi:two-component system response regulator MprA